MQRVSFRLQATLMEEFLDFVSLPPFMHDNPWCDSVVELINLCAMEHRMNTSDPKQRSIEARLSLLESRLRIYQERLRIYKVIGILCCAIAAVTVASGSK
jgi:hypothetical protein